MAWPDSLQVALKEWDSVCRALQSGRQILLLRKGGIHESGGEFELEHKSFLLFPTYLHQNRQMVKSAAQETIQNVTAEPDQIHLSAAGVCTDIVELQSREQMDRLDDQHIWTKPLIDMRFNYRPENPLYVLLVRAYRLSAPVMVRNTPAYAGCKSWVPLTDSIDTRGAVPVLDDVRYETQRRTILDRLRSAR